MRRKNLAAVLAAALLAATAAVAAATPALATDHDVPRDDIVEVPIAFDVVNTNTSKLPCASDGKPYTVKGTIVAPREKLESGDAATLYLHAVTWGEYYWRFKDVPGYDYAHQMAERGHVSVAVDRLGYGESDKPGGLGTCYGSEADVAHQMVDQLRAGEYRLDGAEPTAFDKVFLGGSSVGGLTANVTAYSYKNVDGLFNHSWGDAAATPYTAAATADVVGRCLAGGDPGAPPNYAAFAKTSRETFYFQSAEQAVRDAVPDVKPDPCGQILSIPGGIAADTALLGTIDVPVLVQFGSADPVFGPHPLAIEQMAARYLGSPEVTKSVIPDASHYPLIEREHLKVVEDVDAWLIENGG